MELKTETRTIEGFEVTVSQMPADRALTLLPEVAPIVAAVFSAGHDMEASIGAVLASANVTGPKLNAIVTELLSTATVMHGGKNVSLGDKRAVNMVFSGRIKALLSAAWFAVQVNYGDFFVVDSGTSTDPDPESKG